MRRPAKNKEKIEITKEFCEKHKDDPRLYAILESELIIKPLYKYFEERAKKWKGLTPKQRKEKLERILSHPS